MDKCAENIPQKAKWDIPKGVLGYKGTREQKNIYKKGWENGGKIRIFAFL